MSACPICGKGAAPGYRPFCSRRCADIDLGRWLNESYRLPEAEALGKGPEGDEKAENPSGQAPRPGINRPH